MSAVLPNSNVATRGASAPSSPLATMMSSASDADGVPVFAQVVRDALNRTNNNGPSQPVAAAKTADSSAPSQAPSAYSSKASGFAGVLGLLRQPIKTQGQKSLQATQAAGTLLTAFLANFSPDLIPQNPGSPAPSEAAATENKSVSSTAAPDSDNQTSPVSDNGNPAIPFGSQFRSQFESQLPIQLPAAPPVSTDASPIAPADSPSISNPGNDSATYAPVSSNREVASGDADGTALAAGVNASGVTTGSLSIPAANATSALFISAATYSTASTAPSPTPGSAQSPASKAAVNAQISATSPNPAQGQLLSSVLQQVADLSRSTPNHLPTPVVSVDLARNSAQTQFAQAQFAQATGNSALTASSFVHTTSFGSALASSQLKGAQSASPETHPAASAENTNSSGSNHSGTQDSSSNHGGQDSPDASVTTDPDLLAPVPAKPQGTNFSDALSAVSVLKSDVAPTAQTASVAIPNAAPSVQQNDLPASPATTTVAQAPSPAPPPLPATHLPDAPLGRFVNDAQLTNAASQSEMRIAMQTDKLGAVELHARISGDGIGAAILVEKRDAHAVLAVELPALRQALSDKQLRVDQVSLTQGSLSSTAGDAGAHTQNGQRGANQQSRPTPFWNEERGLTTAAWFVPEQTGIFNAQGRLSVQA